MPDDNHSDGTIIQAAYAERVMEAFRVFAEHLSMGENERSSRDRFMRSVEQTRKARDMALEAVRGAAPAAADDAGAAAQPAPTGDGLSEDERALIEQALSGTTGQRAPAPLPGATARSPLMRR